MVTPKRTRIQKIRHELPAHLVDEDTPGGAELDDVAAFACPFCRRRAASGVDGADQEVVIHAPPTCDQFAKANALEYMEAVAKELVKRLPN